MGLKRIKLGDYIVQRREKFSGEILPRIGVSREGFISPKQEEANFDIYNVLYKRDFVFNPARMELNSILLNTSYEKAMCSSLYEIFYVALPDELLPEYLNLYLKRSEFARYCWYDAVGSARNYFRFKNLCDIEITIPPIEIQQKYSNVYNALVANQKAYEFGLDDMKVVCDAYIEDLRKKNPLLRIGGYIEQRDEKNIDYQVKIAQGVSVDNVFIPAKRVADDTDSGRIVRTGQFAYNKVMKANGTKLPIAYRTGEDCFVSGSYQVFEVTKKDQLLSEYLLLWLKRSETQRYAGFISWGSTRDILLFETLCELQIPIPDLKTQKLIVDIYNASEKRRSINERLKQQISDICPILIKGSIEEAQRG